ncbi:aminopeptidase N-like isoform X2 [Ornithodoros turicata]|uniref:aminopeptidase N-like isoform X2 n=1 Tax=Ornithodoros turicata TaxID=34597 RepID=UPI003139385B
MPKYFEPYSTIRTTAPVAVPWSKEHTSATNPSEINDSSNKLYRPVASSNADTTLKSQRRWWPCLVLASATVIMCASIGSFVGVSMGSTSQIHSVVHDTTKARPVTWWYADVPKEIQAGRKLRIKDMPHARPVRKSFRLVRKVTLFSDITEPGSAVSSDKQETAGYLTAPTEPVHLNETSSTTLTSSTSSPMKLEEGISPVHYVVEIHPNLEGKFEFNGSVTVTFVCRARTSKIALHATAGLQVEVVNLVATFRTVQKPLPLDKITRSFPNDLVVIHLKENLHKNEHYNLTLTYHGVVGEEATGLYRTMYYNGSGMAKWIALTNFKPNHARRVFPCFDDPGLRASFDIIIVRNKELNTLSNMPVQRTERRSNNLVADYFARTPNIPTYLIAFTINDFPSFGKGTMRMWTRAAVTHLAQKMAIDIVPKMLEYYEDYFETKYPMPKLDIVAFANCSIKIAGYFGLIFMREPAFLLLNPRKTMARDAVHHLSVLAHAISGQDGLDLVYEVHDAMYRDSLESALSMTLEPDSLGVTTQPFFNANPKKGVALIRMLEDFLDGENFRKGLNIFLQYYKYESVTEVAVWNAFDKVKHIAGDAINTTGVMHTWTHQKGYPVVTVKRFYRTGSATISQSRYYLCEPESENSPLWFIPITFTTGAKPAYVDHAPVTWLTTGQETVRMSVPNNTWLLLNIKAKGFYRINYDKRNWMMLIRQLREDHTKIHLLNRAQIINDLFDFARSGSGQLSIALSACQYLSNEMEYVPWKAALNAWRYIESLLAATSLMEKWRAFVLRLITPVYTALNWDGRPTEDVQTALLRSEIYKLACMHNHTPCIDHARTAFNAWKNSSGQHNMISRNHRGFVYCKAIELGDYSDWKFLWDSFTGDTHVGSLERTELIWALTCSSNQRVTRTLLKKTLNEKKLRAEDCVKIFSLVARRGTAERNVVLDFIKRNWPSMLIMWQQDFIHILLRVAATIVDEKELDEVRSIYYNFNDTLVEATWAFQTMMKTVKTNRQWMAVQYKELQTWLRVHAN